MCSLLLTLHNGRTIIIEMNLGVSRSSVLASKATGFPIAKIPRFDFEKFPSATGHLRVQIQSEGEVMGTGRTFRESIQEAFRSLEVGTPGFPVSIPPSCKKIEIDLLADC